MKQSLFFFALTIFFISCTTNSKIGGSTGITEAEAAQGIRQALEQGVEKGISLLNKQDGFFNNPTYKLMLPPEAQTIENTFRKLGMGPMVDRAVLQINRAAEDAVGSARPIFTNAITQMSVTDAINIVKGPSNAATQYFKEKTMDKLIAAFTPIIKSSLDKFSATKYYADVINTYNGFPTTINKLNPDLNSYVVNKTIDALFDQVAKEEQNIRSDRKARTTEILKKVFGNASRG
ncbi:MAG TPA: DUF4197 domain-containing protein [Flavisolibacter sp.]|nr:DUF4197 domain-containing protein [Flavisolibacter sp.]